MMQVWRRWCPIAVVGLVAALGARAAFGAPGAPPDPVALAKEMASARADRVADIRNEIVTYNASITDIPQRNHYAETVVDAFAALVKSANPTVKLNAAMLIAQLHTLSTDHALEGMLADKNSGVRYWAAKGLGEIASFKLVNTAGAVKALQNTLATETSGIVKKEIIRSVAELGGAMDIVESLELLANSFQASAPDQNSLEAANLGLMDLNTALTAAPPPTLAPADKVRDAKAVAWLASFAAQQEVTAKQAPAHPGAGGQGVPEGYHALVVSVLNSSMQVLDDIVGASKFPRFRPETSAEENLLNLNSAIGSASVGDGTVQKEIPGTPVPPKIKAGK